jgi:serine/threonine-protein kinase
VWRAVDEAAGHEVAAKVLGPRAAWDMADRSRLRIAFSAVSALSDPGIARVHDYGETVLPSGLTVPYLVRDLVDGRSLEERLADGPAPVDEALGVVARVADALAVAHRAGVVHGNLVPANVILGSAGVKVTDFGLWALRDQTGGAARPDGHTQSVLSYAAPERLSGEPASPAADMYSLGVLFVACLSGIAAAGMAGASPLLGPDDTVAPSLASLWAACLGANPQERPSAAHAAFMSRQILAAFPQGAPSHDDQPEPAVSTSGSTTTAPIRPAAAAPGAPGPEAPSAPGGSSAPGGTRGPGRRPVPPRHRGRGAGSDAGARSGRRDLGRALRGRGGLVALGVVAGVTAAVAMLTQFLASPSAQTTGASATPSVHVQGSPRPSPAGDAGPSPDATASVLASGSPPPLQVLGQIQATIRYGVASGQIRADVAVDLDNLLQPIRTGLEAGNTAQVPQLVAGLRAKLVARLSEGAITQAAGHELSSELAALVRASAGRGG